MAAAGYPRLFPLDRHDEAEVPDLQQGTINEIKKARVQNGEGLPNGNRIFRAHVAHGNLVFGPMPEQCAVKRAPRRGEGDFGKQNWNEVFALMEMQQEGLAGVLLPLAVFKDADYLYIVMPWCQRGDLFERLVNVALDERALREWAVKKLRPLAELYHGGWAHGDLALENFLVADDDTAMIHDVAQAMQVHAPGAPQNEVPIPWYVRTGRMEFWPPEFWTLRGQGGATRSAKKGDVYQLGCIIFALAARRYTTRSRLYPFTLREDGLKTCEASVQRLARLPGASPALQDFLGRLLAPDPEKRLSATGALAHPWITG